MASHHDASLQTASKKFHVANPGNCGIFIIHTYIYFKPILFLYSHLCQIMNPDRFSNFDMTDFPCFDVGSFEFSKVF